MNKLFLVLLLASLFFLHGECATRAPEPYAPMVVDVLFQSLPHTPLVDTIEGATNSKYSHCGMLVQEDGQWFVIEAIGPVKLTPFETWVSHGRGKHFWVYRLSPDLKAKIPAIVKEAKRFLGRPYDFHYSFDDEKIYCSELVFKAVRSATKVKLGKFQRLGDLNWKPYKEVIENIEGYVPVDREMISPQSLSQSEHLVLVHSQ